MEIRICKKCEKEKPITEFKKRSDYGYRGECNECKKLIDKNYYNKNEEKIKETVKKYRKDNAKLVKTKQKESYENNKDKSNIYDRERSKKYREANSNAINERNRTRRKYRYSSDPIYKLQRSVRNRVNQFYKSTTIRKNSKTFDIVGCTPQELKRYLENKFSEGMSWDNYGFYGWHVDHIIPLYYGKTEIEMINLCHYTNLQPMWGKDNFSKGSKLSFLTNNLI